MTLHTTYRPTAFKDVIGQDVQCNALEVALKKKASRSFLLVGPSGTGKTTLARIAAKSVGCVEQSIQEIDAATFTGIDDMRTITSGLMHRPLEGRTKAIILDECHALSASAWKALLKSIEEPPAWCYWFLCTTELNKVPETIKTRCLKIELNLVPTAELTALLDSIVEQEKLDLEGSIVSLCAKTAKGSPRQALVNLEACLGAKSIEDARELLKEVEGSAAAHDLARALLNGVGFNQLQEILKDLKDQNGESVRHVVRAYMTSVILGAKSEKSAGRAAEVLDAFSTPFPYGDGISPVVMACCRLTMQ